MVIDLVRDCDRFALSAEKGISDFDCGNADLNEFFNHDALQYKHQMLSETYFALFNFPVLSGIFWLMHIMSLLSLDFIKKMILRQFFRPKNRKKKPTDNRLPNLYEQDICFTI